MVTRSTAKEVAARTNGRASTGELLTFRDDARSAMLEALHRVTQLKWPSPRYAKNPAAFCREILGYEPWEKQIEVMESVRDNKATACASGHKTGKSRLAASIGLWQYSSFADARVIMTSTTGRQVNQILWRELRMLVARAGRCVACKAQDPDQHFIPRPCPHSALIDGELADLAMTGLKSVDFREVVGFTAKEAEAVAGISGSRLLYICDEASGIPQVIFDAIGGNMAGGGKKLLLGNPTRNEGEFFDAFHGKSKFYVSFTISSEDTPNAIAGYEVIPGLAGREWIEEKREEWGANSALFKIRVLGEFAIGEDGRIFSTHRILEAEQRWDETEAAGRLYIGIDPAGATGSGDESCASVRRGLKQLQLLTKQGMNGAGHLAWALELMEKHALKRETPVLVFDCLGPVGADFHRAVLGYLEDPQRQKAPPFEYAALRASNAAIRQPKSYGTIRDELVANLDRWFADGGAILTDPKLAQECHQYEWKQDARGRYKCTPKDHIRKTIGRSPDRFDATALSVWEPQSLVKSDGATEAERRALSDNEGVKIAPAANDNAAYRDDVAADGGGGDDYYGTRGFR